MDEKDRKIDQLYTELLEMENDRNYYQNKCEFLEKRNKEILEIKKADDTIKWTRLKPRKVLSMASITNNRTKKQIKLSLTQLGQTIKALVLLDANKIIIEPQSEDFYKITYYMEEK